MDLRSVETLEALSSALASLGTPTASGLSGFYTAHIKTFVKFAILSYCKLTQVNYYVQVLKCMVHTPQKSVIHFILALQINVLTQFGWIWLVTSFSYS